MARYKIRNMKPKDAAFEITIIIIGVLVMLITLYPLYYIVIASISEPGLVMTGEVWIYPKRISLEGYKQLLSESEIWVGYRNTIFYAVVGSAISMFITVPAAYALSVEKLKLRRPMMLIFLFTMYFSGGLIPTYLVISQQLHMDNTIWVMLIPGCVNVYNLIIMRSYIESLPKELWEVAQLDGCSHWYYLLKVVIPLSKAVLSVVLLYYIVGKWNEYFQALIYIHKDSLQPLQISLRNILLENESLAQARNSSSAIQQQAIRRAYLIKYSSIIVGTLPMMILYPFLQKYFEKGIMIGAVKG